MSWSRHLCARLGPKAAGLRGSGLKLVARPLHLSAVAWGENEKVMPRSAEETAKWVEKELSQGWQSYGFSYHDKNEDRFRAHYITFVIVSMSMVTIFWLAYFPDPSCRNWAYREAYLVIREREAKGLPLIAKDLIDPDKMELPAEEDVKHVTFII
eukprot:maker-scaffold1523_size37540-snap-gene-0.13 protein:Tk02348 transcript:maker-scaffold1523_size37540-snap-gene-0.13-mRNA-1 annotation:"hypothetical protein CAPTEDRAFT_157472"